MYLCCFGGRSVGTKENRWMTAGCAVCSSLLAWPDFS